MSTFGDVVFQRTCIEKFKNNCISKEDIDIKIKNYNSNKFKRYFLNNKGRTFFMILCIIILFICALYEYPIDGSIESKNTFSKLMSLVGLISANVFLALLFTILGVETYMSQEELKEIKSYLPTAIEQEIENKKSNPKFLDYFENRLLKKYRNKYTTKKIIVDDSTKIARGESDTDINNIKEFIHLLPFDELTQIYDDLKKFKND